MIMLKWELLQKNQPPMKLPKRILLQKIDLEEPAVISVVEGTEEEPAPEETEGAIIAIVEGREEETATATEEQE